MKLIYFLLILLISYSCSSEEKNTQAETKIQKQGSGIKVDETTSNPKQLKIHESEYQILPVDERDQDKSLYSFVMKLKKIIRQKDVNGLINCLDTTIAVSYGGDEYGISFFKTNNALNSEPQKSEIWETLDQLISMGGAWDNVEKSRFCFPYIQSNLLYQRLNRDLDCYSTVTCIDSQVLVYEKPNTNSKKIGILSYEVLTAINVSKEFTQIQSIDKTISGYVLTSQLFRCYNAYPVLEKINGEWKIVSFAPYD